MPSYHGAVLRVLVAVLLSGANVAFAAQYFVSTTGSDSNSGSSGSPWQTLQRAANAVAAGDKVTVLPGNYAGFNLTTSGGSGSPIEFFAQPGVNITSENTFTNRDGINLEGASWVVIDGFNVANMNRAGVRSVGFDDDMAEHITIRNITATNNGKWGIFTGHVDDLLIENNHTSGSVDEHGIYVSNSGDRPIIRNNESWNNHGNGIHMNGDESQGGDGIISGALVSGNIIYNNGTGGGSGINMDGVQNSRIENNLLFDNHSSGISLYKIDGAEGSSGNVVINNTVHQASNGRWALNIQDDSIGNTVLNNILITDHSFRGAIDISEQARTGLVSDYNVMISRFTTLVDDEEVNLNLAQWQALTAQDAHSLAVTPAAYTSLFVNLAADNYQLSATSSARDSGTAQFAPLYDLLNNLRPAGAGFDRGAYEYGATVALGGDFNDDGQVDGRDFLVWQRDPSVGNLADWQAAYGVGVVADLASSAVPEPHQFLLVGFACFSAVVSRSSAFLAKRLLRSPGCVPKIRCS
jgi:parallel beta-helix repeat protein